MVRRKDTGMCSGSSKITLISSVAKAFLLLSLLLDPAEGLDSPSKSPVMGETMNGMGDFLKHSTLAGVVKRSATKMFITPEKVKAISNALNQVVQWEELLLIFTLGWLALPALQVPFDSMNLGSLRRRGRPKVFEETYFHLIFDHISQLAKLAFAVYIVDILKIVLQTLGFNVHIAGNVNHAFAKVLYTAWLSNRIAVLKRFILAKKTDQNIYDLEGEVQIVDRYVDTLSIDDVLGFIKDEQSIAHQLKHLLNITSD